MNKIKSTNKNVLSKRSCRKIGIKGHKDYLDFNKTKKLKKMMIKPRKVHILLMMRSLRQNNL